MANKRNLKKDVNFLTDEFFSDSFALMVMYGDESDKKIVEVMQNVADARNKLIETIQNQAGKGERLNKEERSKKKNERRKELKGKLNDDFKVFIKALEEGYEVLGSLSGD
ncbi:MAG: hypothetical protein C0592_10970 [Marinilabiliales bacterium]|nr:MAG: hypothetical protein C0592_10970 [Marinilabiliales bacterium]